MAVNQCPRPPEKCDKQRRMLNPDEIMSSLPSLKQDHDLGDAEMREIEELVMKLETSCHVYSAECQELDKLSLSIEKLENSTNIGKHLVNLVSSSHSKIAVEPGTWKHKWMIKQEKVLSAEKNMIRNYKDCERLVNYIQGLSYI